MAKCRGCNAEINWMKTEGGHYIPLNPGRVNIAPPLPDESRVTVITRTGKTVIGTQITDDEFDALQAEGREVWMGAEAHWSTCPDRDSFRRKGRNSKGLSFPKRRT